jgi:hypothetical protein
MKRNCLATLGLFVAAGLGAPSQAQELDLGELLAGPVQIENQGVRDEADSFEDKSGYGYASTDGKVVIDADTSAVFCPLASTVIVHPDDVASALDGLSATDNGDGTWNVPDVDGNSVRATVQTAHYINIDIAVPACAIPTTHASIKANQITAVPLSWGICKRVRRCYQCGIQGTCPGPPGTCLSGFYTWSQLKNHLLCRYTGRWQDRCLEFLHPVCRLNRHKCQGCTGGVVQSWNYNRWVCAVF